MYVYCVRIDLGCVFVGDGERSCSMALFSTFVGKYKDFKFFGLDGCAVRSSSQQACVMDMSPDGMKYWNPSCDESIGRLLLQRLKPFNCNLLYHDCLKREPELEKEICAKFEEDLDAMLSKCDVVVINMPLTDKTRGMFDTNRIAKMKKGVLIVNNARGAIMDTQAVVDACSSGHIAGYSGDVWNPQQAPKDHP
ncbi:PREDICTED: formate dehydrogenase, mitochondrial-like [Ipomoea nil]|uniref:formate dehydrogenase, mitochondrial-like n=1 Tax=Ipomoea nil TaxID=35883 RepID=UPI0009013861|nr:PREDICTED: formate dehydrogenase, mitochondrial-like [Ipomoea nil]